MKSSQRISNGITKNPSSVAVQNSQITDKKTPDEAMNMNFQSNQEIERPDSAFGEDIEDEGSVSITQESNSEKQEDG